MPTCAPSIVTSDADRDIIPSGPDQEDGSRIVPGIHRRMLGILIVAMALLGVPTHTASALEPGSAAFLRTWQRSDRPVHDGAVDRSWIWGPEPFTAAMFEPYAESPDGLRVVQYFDKSRMEITNPYGDQHSIWYVTNGLLVQELVTGQLQLGNDAFIAREPAAINVAGDPEDTRGPTFATFAAALGLPPVEVGAVITARAVRGGIAGSDPSLSRFGVTAGTFVRETNHTVASPFWEFMNASGIAVKNGRQSTAPLFENPFFATGFPITEAYWVEMDVGGRTRWLLVQLFERRVLTWTPDNPSGWQVEMGNVGRHYYAWRYGTAPSADPASVDDGAGNPVAPAVLLDWPGDLEGQAALTVANQSPFALAVELDGPVSQRLSIPPCEGCGVYRSPLGFDGCHDASPREQVIVPPGTYRVTIRFDQPRIPPEIGTWTLMSDAIYGECRYVIDHGDPARRYPAKALSTASEVIAK
jgi:hypothetical protein